MLINHTVRIIRLTLKHEHTLSFSAYIPHLALMADSTCDLSSPTYLHRPVTVCKVVNDEQGVLKPRPTAECHICY